MQRTHPMSPCPYDLFAKLKEPLRVTRYNTRHELTRAIGRWIRNIKGGRDDCKRRLPNIWQKVINKRATTLNVPKCSPLRIKPCQKYRTVTITFYPALVVSEKTCVTLALCQYKRERAFRIPLTSLRVFLCFIQQHFVFCKSKCKKMLYKINNMPLWCASENVFY